MLFPSINTTKQYFLNFLILSDWPNIRYVQVQENTLTIGYKVRQYLKKLFGTDFLDWCGLDISYSYRIIKEKVF